MRRIGQAIAILILVAEAYVAHASATPAQKCAAAKLKATGKRAQCDFTCAAKAAGMGLPATDPACLSTCDAKFAAAFTKADLHGPCSGDAAVLGLRTDRFLGPLTRTTWGQSAWGNGCLEFLGGTQYLPCAATNLLFDNFNPLYFSLLLAGQYWEVGLPNGYFDGFDSAQALIAFFPQSGPPGPMNGSLVDNISGASGQFGGEVAALKLNVDFSDAGLLGIEPTAFGDLSLCGLTTDTDLNGMTVRQFLDVANTALGGGSTTDSISDLNALAVQINVSFYGGTPSAFANDHLVEGCCAGGPLTSCGSQCVDLTSDPNNCGSCGKRCNTSASDCNFCSGGTCAPHNLQNDPSNCGTCGHMCDIATQVCSAGVCQ